MPDQPKIKPEWGSLTSNEFQSNEKWWPNSLNLRILHQHHPDSTGGDKAISTSCTETSTTS